MLSAVLWGGLAAASLLIGYVLSGRGLSNRTIGIVMGFGAGALLSAIAYELVPETALGGGMMGVTFLPGRPDLLRGGQVDRSPGRGGSQGHRGKTGWLRIGHFHWHPPGQYPRVDHPGNEHRPGRRHQHSLPGRCFYLESARRCGWNVEPRGCGTFTAHYLLDVDFPGNHLRCLCRLGLPDYPLAAGSQRADCASLCCRGDADHVGGCDDAGSIRAWRQAGGPHDRNGIFWQQAILGSSGIIRSKVRLDFDIVM